MTVNDSSGLGNNGTVVNTAEWGPGTLILSATNKAVVKIPIVSSAFPVLNGAKTVSLWVYYDRVATANTNFVVLSDGVTSVDLASSAVQFEVRDGVLKVGGSHTAIYVTTTVAPPAAAAWHHLVYTDDGAGTHAIYVDGVTTHATFAGALPVGPTPCVLIGSWTTDSTSPWFEHLEASVADVRVYNRALSQDEVTASCNAGRSGAPNRVDASGSYDASGS